jgi:hypothetical protein
MLRLQFGPSRTYVGTLRDGESTLEVRYSDGRVESMEPNPNSSSGPEFAWDYSGSGPLETASAILHHALGESFGPHGDYSDRVENLCRDFVDAFLGDVHHDEIVDGFELPGELVVLWVMKNEPRILEDPERGASKTLAEIADSLLDAPQDWVRGSPTSLVDVMTALRRQRSLRRRPTSDGAR